MQSFLRLGSSGRSDRSRSYELWQLCRQDNTGVITTYDAVGYVPMHEVDLGDAYTQIYKIYLNTTYPEFSLLCGGQPGIIQA